MQHAHQGRRRRIGQQRRTGLRHLHHAAQGQALHQLGQHLSMPVEAVGGFFLGFVAAAEADQVRRHHAVAGLREGRQHGLPAMAPARAGMQQQPGAGGVARAFVQVVQAQAGQRGQIAHVMRRGAVQMGERGVGRAQRVLAQRVGGQLLRPLGAAAVAEEVAQQCTAFIGQHAALHRGLVVETRLGEQVDHRARSAGLGIRRAVDHARQARVQHGAAAHGARLQRDVERAAVEPVVGELRRAGAQRGHLGMRRGVVPGDGGIAPGGDHLPIAHQHGAHGHLARLLRGARLGDGLAHPVGVVGFAHLSIAACA